MDLSIYEMFEALSWFFSAPLLGKALFPILVCQGTTVTHTTVTQTSIHAITARTLNGEIRACEAAEEMVATEQQAIIRP